MSTTGLRQEESGPLWDVSHRVRPRPAVAGDLGDEAGKVYNQHEQRI